MNISCLTWGGRFGVLYVLIYVSTNKEGEVGNPPLDPLSVFHKTYLANRIVVLGWQYWRIGVLFMIPETTYKQNVYTDPILAILLSSAV